MDRRRFLGFGAAALVLAGCTDAPDDPIRPTASAQDQDPDATVRAEVAASEAALIGAYRDLIAAAPERASTLDPLLAQHEQHLARVAPQIPASGADTDEGASATVSPEPAASDGPGNPAPDEVGLAELAGLQARAVAQRTRACDAASDPQLARDLCFIAASEAQHAEFLAGLLADEEA